MSDVVGGLYLMRNGSGWEEGSTVVILKRAPCASVKWRALVRNRRGTKMWIVESFDFPPSSLWQRIA